MPSVLVFMIVSQAACIFCTTPHYVLQGFASLDACEKAIPAVEAALAVHRMPDDEKSVLVPAHGRCLSVPNE